ncbi:MAG: PilZ domain-containing protein [Candidatus Omnitrophica bacterium]|nr:PilZ domain-containing protein [Candidatus Omnitrophota bacterium]
MAKIRKERRKFKRLNVYHLAKYRLISKSNQSPIIAAIKDIGGGGICLNTEEYLPIASVIQLYVNFPKFPQAIPALAKIMWIKKIGRKNRYEAGIEFVDIEQIFRNAIVRSVEAVRSIATK